MEKDKSRKTRSEYKIIISELGLKPFNVINIAFLLIGIIPILSILYVIIGKNFFYDLIIGSNGFIIASAILISVIGFVYAYNLINRMMKKLLAYSYERKRSDDVKTEMLLAVSHDLKTPLTVVKTGMQNLLEGIGGPVSNTHSKIAQVCLNAVNKLIGFINELLNASRTHFVRVNFKRELFDFNELIKKEIDEISTLAKKENQDLRYRILTADTNIWGDKSKLARAVMNLLSNAVKYAPSGGKIDVILSGTEDTVMLAVINSGSQIRPEELNKVFDKFERLESHSEVKGSGVGLSIVKEIVDLHNGHLTAKSEPGKEIEFDIVLPKDLRGERK